jgi:hypothetical protein
MPCCILVTVLFAAARTARRRKRGRAPQGVAAAFAGEAPAMRATGDGLAPPAPAGATEDGERWSIGRVRVPG